MTAQELLPIFEKAVVDWSKSVDKDTKQGLCWYFDTLGFGLSNKVKKYWLKYRTTMGVQYFFWHFYGDGSNTLGRKQRLEALKLVVRDLKEEIKQQENETN